MRYYEIIFWIFVIGFTIYAIYAEMLQNQCYTRDKKGCFSIYKTEPESSDTNADTAKRIDNALRINEETVYWRRSYLISITLCLLFFFLFFKRLPFIHEFVIFTIITFAILYMVTSFYDMHYFYVTRLGGLNSLDKLRKIFGIPSYPDAPELQSR